MYRCRIITFILSLAICISFFIFSVNAEEYYSYPGVSLRWGAGSSQNSYGTANTISITNNFMGYTPYEYWYTDRISIYHYNQDCDFYVSFEISFVCLGDNKPNVTGYTDRTGKINGSWDSGSGEFVIIPFGRMPTDTYIPSDYGFISLNRRCTLHFKYNSYSGGPAVSSFVFTNPTQFYSSGSPPTKIIPIVHHVEFASDILGAMQQGFFDVNDSLNTIDSKLYQLYENTVNITSEIAYINQFNNSLSNKLFSNYSFSKISYNNQLGRLETSNSSGDYFDALLGSLQSISADAEAQAAIQEKANNAGAADALDNAYNSLGSSSFGSLSDLSGIGNIASWNGNNFGSASNDGFLGWFSQENLNAIDSVPQSRTSNDIINFYNNNLNEILDGIGGDDP